MKGSITDNLTNLEALKAFVTHQAQESTPIAEARKNLLDLADQCPNMTIELSQALCKHAQDVLAPRRNNFLRCDRGFKKELAYAFADTGDLYEACNTLSQAAYDPSQYASQAECERDMAEDYMTLADWYFKQEDFGRADTKFNKVSALSNEGWTALMKLNYVLLLAIGKDSKREYDAASNYFLEVARKATDDELTANDCFNKAVICRILCPAGSTKDTRIANLFKDERAKMSDHYELLRKFATSSVVRRQDVERLEKALKTHQQVRYSDGYTALDKALIEHNMTVLSKVYLNITFQELGHFLGISTDQAEDILAKMISENRLKGVILDQVN